jgi:hypothetical protein
MSASISSLPGRKRPLRTRKSSSRALHLSLSNVSRRGFLLWRTACNYPREYSEPGAKVPETQSEALLSKDRDVVRSAAAKMYEENKPLRQKNGPLLQTESSLRGQERLLRREHTSLLLEAQKLRKLTRALQETLRVLQTEPFREESPSLTEQPQ